VTNRGDFEQGAVSVRSTGWVVDPDDGQPVAAVLLEVENRPDVADLARVVALEGPGDLRCGIGVWDLDEPVLVRLEVALDHPVHCRFHLVLGWAEHATWLASVADGGAMAVGTGDGDGSWLLLNVDGRRLGEVLDLLGPPADAGPTRGGAGGLGGEP
jgi:hypothetical protein